MKLTHRVLACTALVLASASAQAAEVNLRAVSAFGMDTFFSQRFKAFVDKVNTEGKGIMRIQVVGGPESIPTLEIGGALRAGVVDLANTNGVFHANLVPEALAMSFTDKPMEELRANGGYEMLDQIHRQKANITWLGRVSDGLKYHIYTNKPLKDGNFDGMKLRSVPVYRSFFQSIGAVPMQMPPGEVYTALERGMVDGYGWPSIGVFDLGWQEKTRYRVEPGFYNVEVGLFMNQNSWKKLTDEQRAFLEKQVAWAESQNAGDQALAEAEKAKLQAAGIQSIDLPADQVQGFLEKAQQAGWAGIEQVSPQNAARLRPLFGG